MKAHLDAIRAELESLEYATHLFAAPVVSSQYLILSSPSWGGPLEAPVASTSGSVDVDVRVKAVAGTPEGVAIMLGRVRSLLGPDNEWVRVAVSSRVAQVRFVRSEFIDVDRDVTITNTDRHPGVGVDTYRLVSEPTR